MSAKRERESSILDVIPAPMSGGDSPRKRVAFSPSRDVSAPLDSSPPLTGQETRFLTSDSHDPTQDGASRPRIGGWFMGVPRSSATVPEVEYPPGAPVDEDDRPLLDDREGSGGGFWDRPWVVARRRAEEERRREEERRKVEEAKVKAEAAQALESTNHDSIQPSETHAIAQSTKMPAAITPTTREIQAYTRNAPQFLKSDLACFVAGETLPATSPLWQKDVWVVASTDQSKVLLCNTKTNTTSVLAVPAQVARVLSESKEVGVWFDAQGRRFKNDGSVEEEVSTPAQPAPPPAPAPSPSIIDDLKEQLATLTERTAAAEAATEGALQTATLSRQLYDDASRAARAAMSEASDAQESLEKAQRQLREGLAAHRERYNTSLAQWAEEKRQLQAQIKLLTAQDSRHESAEMRRKINEYRALLKGEEELRKRQEERRRREEEIDMDELAQLRSESGVDALEEGGRRARRVVQPPPSDGVQTGVIADSSALIPLDQQGPFARSSALAPSSPTLEPTAAHTILAQQDREARRLLSDERARAGTASDEPLQQRVDNENGLNTTTYQRTLADAQAAETAHRRQLDQSAQDVDEQMSMWESGEAEQEDATRADLEKEFFKDVPAQRGEVQQTPGVVDVQDDAGFEAWTSGGV